MLGFPHSPSLLNAPPHSPPIVLVVISPPRALRANQVKYHGVKYQRVHLHRPPAILAEWSFHRTSHVRTYVRANLVVRETSREM